MIVPAKLSIPSAQINTLSFNRSTYLSFEELDFLKEKRRAALPTISNLVLQPQVRERKLHEKNLVLYKVF